MADILLRPQRCIRCARLSTRIFTLGDRYLCDRDECLDKALDQLNIPLRDREQLKARLRAEFNS
jgi:hypothetical protein